MDGWSTNFPFGPPAYFQGLCLLVSVSVTCLNPENQWLEDMYFLLWWPLGLFSEGEMAVSGSVGSFLHGPTDQFRLATT